ncbi:hypothetical protein Krac_3933 [Ktedonobacter racemifer DSM 44963]|uniref:Uncharacterized protein n=1 Tax=Ktedonobacter racemifer DSM 44963 TaxID=485913 RepID=D6U3N2_KTERA|nr:hypothetical protein Krac_3933 [Ktedonobacter racemifer DSM 44963]
MHEWMSSEGILWIYEAERDVIWLDSREVRRLWRKKHGLQNADPEKGLVVLHENQTRLRRLLSTCKFQSKREREMSLNRPFSSNVSAKYFNVSANKVQIFSVSAKKADPLEAR